jgi:DNA polymerase-3 subunit alpha
MQLCQVLGGYSLGGADLLRRAIGKKKPEELAKHRSQFRAGASERGIPAERADALFDLIEKFAGYGFNKSHAAAYALLSYQTAYLKAHYPAEFMAAVLSSEMDHTEKLVTFLEEARALGLRILPPDVNHSEAVFVGAADGEIRYGLGAIKGVGAQVATLIAEERRRNGPYRDLYDFCARMATGKLNRRTLEALIHSGALDRLGFSRQALLEDLGPAIKHAERQQHERSSGQIDLFAVPSESSPWACCPSPHNANVWRRAARAVRPAATNPWSGSPARSRRSGAAARAV